MICCEYIWQAVPYTLAISLKGNKLCLKVKKKEEIRGYRGWEAKQNEKDPLHQ